MSISHRKEEIVKIVTPLALGAVEEQAEKQGVRLTDKEKAIEAVQTIEEMIGDLKDQNLNLPCSGPYCGICGLCSF